MIQNINNNTNNNNNNIIIKPISGFYDCDIDILTNLSPLYFYILYCDIKVDINDVMDKLAKKSKRKLNIHL
jgi:hypothetical protein